MKYLCNRLSIIAALLGLDHVLLFHLALFLFVLDKTTLIFSYFVRASLRELCESYHLFRHVPLSFLAFKFTEPPSRDFFLMIKSFFEYGCPSGYVDHVCCVRRVHV